MAYADLRDKLEANQKFFMIGAAVVILLSIVILIVQLTGGGATNQTQTTLIYYDLKTQAIRLVEHDLASGSAPMSPADDANEVFMASVWYCGDRPKRVLSDGMTLEEVQEAGMFIAWLEKDDPAVEPSDYMTRPLLYRTLDDPAWHKAEAPQTIEILESPLDQCEDAKQYVAK